MRLHLGLHNHITDRKHSWRRTVFLHLPTKTYFSCSRHLSRTYRRALQHTTPDVICFLGDLMDEGSVATDVQYDEYFARFADIFTQPTADTLMVRPYELFLLLFGRFCH